MKIVVIGAGASGIIASLIASKNNEVILLDSNDKIGKKILLTGNGKCNYWNNDISFNNYNSLEEELNSILSKKEEVFNYLTKIGIYPRIKNGYYYPNSNQASSVVEVFKRELNKSNIKIVLNCKVNDILKEDKFIIKSNIEDIICDKVIVASGGCSYPKTGSDGSMFKVLEKFHTINKLMPSLVPLVTKEKIKDLTNLRVDGKISLFINNKKEKEEVGEIQFTDYGISGICVFNISGLVNKNLDKNIYVKINFLNDIDNIYNFLEERKDIGNISEVLETVIPYQLVSVILKKVNIKDESWYDLDEGKKEELISLLTEFKLDIEGTLDFDRSQVTTGGIPLSEVNIETMESKKVNGLYLVGELLDVDGKCGGFNLGFAFITGYIAGIGV